MTRKYSLYLSLFVSGIVLTACATTVDEKTPEQIAAQSFPILDSYTGLEQVRLPSIRQGGWSGSQVTAYLQTAESYQDQSGGAWLDVVINYETPTPDPAEMQVFNRGVWAGGEPVQLADFSATVLSCSERVQSYGNGYYGRGGYYGGGYYGRGRYDRNRRGRYHDRRHRDRDRDGHYDRDGERRDGGRDGRNRDNDRADDRERQLEDRQDAYVRPRTPGGNPVRPDPRVAPDERDEPAISVSIPQDDTETRSGRRSRGGNTGNVTRGVKNYERRRVAPRVEKDPVRRASPVSVSRPQVRTTPRPATQSRPVSRPAPSPSQSRPTKAAPRPKPKSRPAPKKQSSPKAERELKGMYFNDEAAAQKSDSSSVDVSKRGYGYASYRHRGYRGYNRGIWPRSHWGGEYWGPYRDGIIVTQSCNRREQLRIYVPQDQLQYAQGYRGLTLLLRGEGGLERQVSLSQNYLIGYNLVARDYEQPYRPSSDKAELTDPFEGE